jgi:hypothetical protein
MATNYRHTPIPSKGKDGTPTSYFTVDENCNHTPSGRAECIEHDELGAPHLFVEPDGSAIFRLPRTALGQQLARENMQYIWREDQRARRRSKREFSIDSAVAGTGYHEHFRLIDPTDIASIVDDAALLDALTAAAATLTDADRHLIYELFWNQKSERQLAAELGLKSHKTISYRKAKALAKLAQVPALKNFKQEI